MTVPQDYLPCMKFFGEFVAHSLFAHTFCVTEVRPAEQP